MPKRNISQEKLCNFLEEIEESQKENPNFRRQNKAKEMKSLFNQEEEDQSTKASEKDTYSDQKLDYNDFSNLKIGDRIKVSHINDSSDYYGEYKKAMGNIGTVSKIFPSKLDESLTRAIILNFENIKFNNGSDFMGNEIKSNQMGIRTNELKDMTIIKVSEA
jgi:hypothetical protein